MSGEDVDLLAYALLVCGLAALVTWALCSWWYGRKLRKVQQALERVLLSIGESQVSRVAAVRNRDTTEELTGQIACVEALEEILDASETNHATPRPFLHTSPLTHLEEGERSAAGNERRQSLCGRADL